MDNLAVRSDRLLGRRRALRLGAVGLLAGALLVKAATVAWAGPADEAGPRQADGALRDERGGSVKMLKYSVPSRAYGVH